MPYVHQNGMQRLSSHEDFRESLAAPRQVQKQLERAEKGDWLGIFMEVRGWDQSEGLNLHAWFKLLCSAKGELPGYLISLPR